MTKNATIWALLVAAMPCASAQAQCAGKTGGALRETSSVELTKHEARQVGGDLVVNLALDLSRLQVSKSQSVVLTPVVVKADSMRALPAVVVNGKQRHVLYQRLRRPATERELRRENGTQQTVSYTASTPFATWMKGAKVQLVNDSCGCGWSNLGPSAYQPITMIDPEYPLCFVTPKAETKTYALSGSAFLDFPVSRTEIYPNYRKNPRELQKIFETINTVKNDANATITHISIHGYASPESPLSNNTRLANGRAAALRDYVSQLMKLPASIFEVQATPEDWKGLRRYVADSTGISHRQEILRIIDSDMELDPKEARIKAEYPEEYRYMLQNWYPALRHSDYVVEYAVRSFSVEEAKALLHTKPQQLSLNELYLVAQTYEPGTPEYEEVFETAVRLFPDSPEANLNSANVALREDRLTDAERYLQKAGSSAAAQHARGVLAAKRQDFTTAQELFTEASRAGVKEADEALEILKGM